MAAQACSATTAKVPLLTRLSSSYLQKHREVDLARVAGHSFGPTFSGAESLSLETSPTVTQSVDPLGLFQIWGQLVLPVGLSVGWTHANLQTTAQHGQVAVSSCNSEALVLQRHY